MNDIERHLNYKSYCLEKKNNKGERAGECEDPQRSNKNLEMKNLLEPH